MAKPGNHKKLTVLIVGGYGNFGARLVGMLSEAPELRLIIAGRSPARAQAMCAGSGAAERRPAAFDLQGDIDAQLAALKPDIVVDTAGPFQAYGADPYRLARAAVGRGVAYLDIADGRAFVCGIGALNELAIANDTFALSGCSSVPALSDAVLRRLADGMTKTDRVEGGITPSGRLAMGLSVIQAIASYAGKRVTLRVGGQAVRRYCLTDGRRHVLAVPGVVPLVPRRFGLIDVPDLDLMPKRCAGLQTVMFGAGLRPGIAHHAVRLAAWAVRLRLLPSLLPFARIMRRTARWMVGGEPRGGMFVRLSGRDEAGPVTREWVLIAEGDDGPNIPLMACVALIRRIAAGRPPEAGARPCLDELDLDEFVPLFARFQISTGIWQERATEQPLYRALLGSAYELLPAPVAEMHDIAGEKTVSGRANVERGTGWLARLLARFARLPSASDDIEVTVTFRRKGDREVWERRYGPELMSSASEAGRGAWRHLVVERFGLIAFGFALTADERGLEMHLRRWSIAGVRLPLWLAPRLTAVETQKDGVFQFDVSASSRLAGPIVRYRGWLA
ncbi:MAG: DUF4166 domain-containing protein [Pseudomonadota bacterium]